MSVIHSDYPRSPKTLPDLLRKIRLDLRLQIKDAAKEAGINEWTITNWEKGRCWPSRRLLERLVGVYAGRDHPEAEGLLRFAPRIGGPTMNPAHRGDLLTR